jgi:hypothetical protein
MYSVAFYLTLLEKYPNRCFLIVFHTAGVTQRKCEVSEILEYFRIPFEISDDFSDSFFYQLVKKSCIFLLRLGRISVRESTPNTVVRLYLWTREVRGHYAHQVLTPNLMSTLDGMFFSGRSALSQAEPALIHIHMRLGDLQTLESKAPLGLSRILRALSFIPESLSGARVLVHSDSPEIAIKMISSAYPHFEFTPSSDSALDVIHQQKFADIFIATPSKISEWAIGFRLYEKKDLRTLVPIEMQNELFFKFPFLKDSSNVIIY